MAPRILNLNMVLNYLHSTCSTLLSDVLPIIRDVKHNETPKLKYTNIYIFTNLIECPTEYFKTKGNASDLAYSLLESSF